MSEGVDLYLDLMKRVLVNSVYQDAAESTSWLTDTAYDAERRAAGQDWPTVAHTMVGTNRLDNVQECVETVLAENVPGDLVETGVWRGGVCILMRAILKAHGVTDRTVWAADSFAGIPDVGGVGHPLDQKLGLHRFNDVLSVSLEDVRENFRRYGLLDDQVRFLCGWFADTLPSAPVDRIAVLRLDGDLYDSTMDALTTLYPRLSPGGYLIVDDYDITACRQAVHDYRREHGVDDAMEGIDNNGVFWRRT
ncbi:TylF/MycF family methyltransferase [Micromonospora sp. NPDC048830]|uniref:TylF/MycF family methyltransferase n=1 Tax=Micromonospora sp. NPDC048830 TaxID=3364257 RepID=UPI00372263BF